MMESNNSDLSGKESGGGLQLTDLLEDVIVGYILPLLKWNDLLRVRRVSKDLNGIINKYIMARPKLAPEIEINETNKSFSEFMKLGIPSTKFYFDNDQTGDQFYENPDIPDFLQLHGGQITHLRVTAISYFVTRKERVFFDELTSLECLEASAFQMFSDFPFGEHVESDQRMPATIRRLKSLRVKMEQRPRTLREIYLLMLWIFSECTELEDAMLPFSELLEPLEGSRVEDIEHIRRELPNLANTINRIKEVANGERYQRFLEEPKLKTYDFENFYVPQRHARLDVMERIASPKFIELCQQCMIHGVKLKNVVASWLPEVVDEDIDPAIGECILSLVNLNPSVFAFDLENVEEINIKATSRCMLHFDYATDKPYWPNLRKLVITVDSEDIHMTMNPKGRIGMVHSECSTLTLFVFFFRNFTHPELTELELVWKEDRLKVVLSQCGCEDDMITACPNLTKLTIVNWPGTNKSLCKFWSGLPALEEVCLDGCKRLGNVAFVGADIDNPVFLNLKNLKRLSLKNLDQMPKITDTLFKLVLKSLNLTHLTLSSAVPLEKITPTGIRSLLTGSFASSIDKFPFTGWSIKNCTDDDFMKLEAEFRSYYMI